MKSNEAFLGHILEEVNFLLQQTGKMSFEQLMKDEVLKRACARSLEVIGEAAKNVSSDFKRKHKTVDWKRLAGMRDKLVHHYFGVNWDILWNVLQEKMPELKAQMESILAIKLKNKL